MYKRHVNSPLASELYSTLQIKNKVLGTMTFSITTLTVMGNMATHKLSLF